MEESESSNKRIDLKFGWEQMENKEEEKQVRKEQTLSQSITIKQYRTLSLSSTKREGGNRQRTKKKKNKEGRIKGIFKNVCKNYFLISQSKDSTTFHAWM